MIFTIFQNVLIYFTILGNWACCDLTKYICWPTSDHHRHQIYFQIHSLSSTAVWKKIIPSWRTPQMIRLIPTNESWANTRPCFTLRWTEVRCVLICAFWEFLAFVNVSVGKTFDEINCAKFCKSCGEKTAICPHKVTKEDMIVKLPKRCTHVKVSRPQVRTAISMSQQG